MSVSSHEIMERKTRSNIHIAWCAVTWSITTMMLMTFCLWHATTNVPISKYEWIWENYHLSTARQPWHSCFNFYITLKDFSNSHFVLLTHKIIWLNLHLIWWMETSIHNFSLGKKHQLHTQDFKFIMGASLFYSSVWISLVKTISCLQIKFS